jgi:hypothetical protein
MKFSYKIHSPFEVDVKGLATLQAVLQAVLQAQLAPAGARQQEPRSCCCSCHTQTAPRLQKLHSTDESKLLLSLFVENHERTFPLPHCPPLSSAQHGLAKPCKLERFTYKGASWRLKGTISDSLFDSATHAWPYGWPCRWHTHAC